MPFTLTPNAPEVDAADAQAGQNDRWTLNFGPQHAFTNPDADRHGIDNIKYSEAADKRSFAAMKALFDEVFGK